MRSSPIDDLTYDVLTVLHQKAKGLEAYEKYIQDAEDDDELSELFRALQRQDEDNVRLLKEALASRLDAELGEGEEDDVDEDEDWDDDDEVEDQDDDLVEPRT